MQLTKMWILILSLAIFGCEADDDTKESDTTNNNTQQPQNPQTIEIPELSPADGLSLVEKSINSSAEAGNIHPGSLAIGLIDSDLECPGDSGMFAIQQEAETNSELGEYAAFFTYCNLSYKSNGPDTAQGAIARVKGVLCAVGDDLEYEGVEQDLSIDFAAPCFTQTFADMVEEELGKTTFDAKITGYSSVPTDFEGSTEFEKAIKIEIEEIGFAYRVLYTHDTTANTLAVSIRDGVDEDDDPAVFSVFLDTNAEGTIRYEGIFERDSRHVRALLQGTFDSETDSFTAVTNLEFLSFEAFDDPGGARFITVKGNPTDGYKAIYSFASPDDDRFDVSSYDYSGTKSHCYGEGDCSSNDGLVPTTNDDLDFVKVVIRDDAAYLSPFTWFENHGPLEFTTVTFAKEQD